MSMRTERAASLGPAAENTNHGTGYTNSHMPSMADLQERLGRVSLRLQGHRICTSIVAEFDHLLRAYVDAREVQP